ncbi:MAG: redox-sensing transcriptional repressor Rex [Clostridia bacterium]
MSTNISTQTLQRLPLYLNFLKEKKKSKAVNISSSAIAEELGLVDIQVRKDLASVSNGGKPKVGYIIENLIIDIKIALGYDNTNDAVLIGAGNLGKALLSYEGFSEYGLNIVAAFDTNAGVINEIVNGKLILQVDKLKNLCQRMKIHIGIITVPAECAQSVCNMLVESGVVAIWNFAPTHLKAPENIMIKSENMAASLAVLSKHLTEKIFSDQEDNTDGNNDETR